MELLDKDIEVLLQECLNRADDFPAILAEKFEGLTSVEDGRLRSRIKFLCDNGYFSKLNWASDLPYIGRIEQKGFAEKYNNFIQSIANHMTIFAPFIPALSSLLTSAIG